MTLWADPNVHWADATAYWGQEALPSASTTFSVDGPISTAYRFDLLDADENYLGTLDTVTGGEVSWDAYASVKGGGSITVRDVNTNVDWLNVRVRPVIIRTLEGTGLPSVEHPVGVFLCAAPVETWTMHGREWKVELTDKLAVPDQDIPAVQYSLPAGTNIIDAVTTILNEAGENTPAIEPDTQTLALPILWEPGATRLKVINDLLDAGEFFSLWCDPWGQYQCTPYVYPTDRTPLFETATPFSKGDLSLMAPDWTLDNDIYSIPNRYVVITQGSEDSPALTSTAVNMDLTSPYSYQSRNNRWITKVETGVETVDQTTLDAYGRRQLSAATSVTVSISLDHLYLPDLLVNSVVRFANPDADLDVLCAVIKTTIPFEPTSLCKSEFRDVGPYVETEA